jgi:hypothetical protein
VSTNAVFVSSLLVAGLVAGAASAEPATPVTPVYAPVAPAVPVAPEDEPVAPVAPVTPVAPAPVAPVAPVAPEYAPAQAWAPRTGGALLVGGGFDDFTDGNLRRMTSVGGAWSVRGVAGTRRIIGFEAAYVGSAHGIDALGLGGNARLVSNGAEGALRLNIPVEMPFSLVEPFGFAGLGWARYSIMNTSVNNSDLASRDDVMTVPWGAGLEVGYHGLMADARFTYRHTYFDDLAPGSSLNSWGIGGQIGFGY